MAYDLIPIEMLLSSSSSSSSSSSRQSKKAMVNEETQSGADLLQVVSRFLFHYAVIAKTPYEYDHKVVSLTATAYVSTYQLLSSLLEKGVTQDKMSHLLKESHFYEIIFKSCLMPGEVLGNLHVASHISLLALNQSSFDLSLLFFESHLKRKVICFFSSPFSLLLIFFLLLHLKNHMRC